MYLTEFPLPALGHSATQHLLNCSERLLAAPEAPIGRLADLMEVDREQGRLWPVAREAAEPRETWNDEAMRLARALNSIRKQAGLKE